MSTLKERAIIVNLTISLWGGRKQDRKVTREVEEAHQAKDAGVFIKKLIRSTKLEMIQQVSNQLRIYHRNNSLPWSDNGDRIISNEGYFQYITEIGQLKFRFNQLVDEFTKEYADLKDQAKRSLNTLYREQDYPHEHEIKDKFGIKVSFMPIAEADDLRVQMSDDMISSMKKQITSEIEERIQNAIESLLERIRKAVSHMAETLADPDKKFHDTLVGNVQELMETAPILNFVNDKHVNEVVKMLQSLIVDPEALRYDMPFREDIAKKAKSILENI